MALPHRPQPSSNNLATWIAKVKTLSPEQHKDFILHSRDDLTNYIQEFEEIAQKANPPKRSNFPVLHVLDPTHSTLLMGGVASVLSSSMILHNFDGKVTDRLETMLEKLHTIEEYDSLYFSQAGVQEIAVLLCEDIFDFCIEMSSRFLDKNNVLKNGLRRLKGSLASSSQKFASLEKKFDDHLAKFNNAVTFAQADNIGKILKHQDRNIKEHSRHKLLDAIPSADFEGVQNDRLDKLMEGTGQWLLENSKFKSLIETPSSDLLWVHGKHGCGKSYLAARTIEHLSSIQHADDVAMNLTPWVLAQIIERISELDLNGQ